MANCSAQNVSKVHPRCHLAGASPFLTDRYSARARTDRILFGQVFGWTCVFTSLGIDLGVEWLGHKVM